MSKIDWGNYTVSENHSWFTVTRTEWRGNTDVRIGYKERWDIGGTLQSDNIADLMTEIDEIEAELRQPGRDLLFYTGNSGDGYTLSAHTLYNSDTIDGTRVVAMRFPKGLAGIWGSGAEIANGCRAFQFSVEGIVYDPDGNIMEYHESIRQLRSGTRKFEMVESLQGQPQEQTLVAYPAVVVEQVGLAVGIHTRPIPQVPLFPLYVMNEPFMQGYDTPTKFAFYRNVGFPTAWRYIMKGPPGVVGLIPPQPVTF